MRIISDIAKEEYNRNETEEESGFRAGRSTIPGNIFRLKKVVENKIATARELHLLLIDLAKACDNVPTAKLWPVLQESGINHTVVKAIKTIYITNQY